jgi:predicted flap endonuclease-1-like 5' DNA nuclease
MTTEILEMTKKIEKKADKKTVKKETGKKVAEDKSVSVATLKKIDSKLISTKQELENQVDNLSAQVKKVSKKSGKKAFKLLKKLDDSYRRRLVNFQTEFEERLASLSLVKDKVVELLPNVLAEQIGSTEIETTNPTTSKKVTNKKPVLKSRSRVTSKTSTIASIKSIGPVMQKKLAAQGITSLDDIANTPKNKVETLEQFAKERGFNTWKVQAKTLLENNENNADC